MLYPAGWHRRHGRDPDRIHGAVRLAVQDFKTWMNEDADKKKEGMDRRTYLRNLPQQCDGKSVEELLKILETDGVIKSKVLEK